MRVLGQHTVRARLDRALEEIALLKQVQKKVIEPAPGTVECIWCCGSGRVAEDQQRQTMDLVVGKIGNEVHEIIRAEGRP